MAAKNSEIDAIMARVRKSAEIISKRDYNDVKPVVRDEPFDTQRCRIQIAIPALEFAGRETVLYEYNYNAAEGYSEQLAAWKRAETQLLDLNEVLGGMHSAKKRIADLAREFAKHQGACAFTVEITDRTPKPYTRNHMEFKLVLKLQLYDLLYPRDDEEKDSILAYHKFRLRKYEGIEKELIEAVKRVKQSKETGNLEISKQWSKSRRENSQS